MTENIENIKNTRIDEVIDEILHLRQENRKLKQDIMEVSIHEKMLVEENKQLHQDNNVLGNELTYFKEYSADLEEKVNDLQSENTHFKAKNLALTKRLQNITLWDLSPEAQEEAGHQLARELLGGR